MSDRARAAADAIIGHAKRNAEGSAGWRGIVTGVAGGLVFLRRPEAASADPSGYARILPVIPVAGDEAAMVAVGGGAAFAGVIDRGASVLAPTPSAAAGAGTGPSVAIVGNDTDGRVTVTTGTGTATGSMVRVTFAKARANTNYTVTAFPGSSSAAGLAAYNAVRAVAYFEIGVATTAPAASTQFIFHYGVRGF